MGGWNGWSSKAAFLTAVLGPSLALSAQAGPLAPAFEVRIRDGATADTVRRALRGAAERLENPKCGEVFSDFSDASGRPLSDRLADLGQTPEGYLGRVLFYDGTIQPRCGTKSVLAVTTPGSPVVFVCPGVPRPLPEAAALRGGHAHPRGPAHAGPGREPADEPGDHVAGCEALRALIREGGRLLCACGSRPSSEG